MHVQTPCRRYPFLLFPRCFFFSSHDFVPLLTSFFVPPSLSVYDFSRDFRFRSFIIMCHFLGFAGRRQLLKGTHLESLLQDLIDIILTRTRYLADDRISDKVDPPKEGLDE